MSGLTFPNPSGASGARGYSHLAVAAGPGTTVYVAGTFGMKDGKFAGKPGDFRAQCEQAFEGFPDAELKPMALGECADAAYHRADAILRRTLRHGRL